MVAAACWVLRFSVLLAQEEPGTIKVSPAEEEGGEDGPSRPVSGRRRGYRFSSDLSFSGIYDSNVLRDDDEVGAQGMAAGAIFRLQTRPGPTVLRLRYAGTAYRFTETDRWNRFSQSLSATIERKLSKTWTLDLVTLASLDVLTVEFRRADLYSLLPRFEFSPSRTHRFRISGALRHKEYNDTNGSSAFNPYISCDYRYRWGSWHYLDVMGSMETNRAQLEPRVFDAVTGEITYTRPLSRDYRVRGGLRFRHWRYENAEVQMEDEVVDLEDWRWSPTVSWIHDLAHSFRLEAEYLFDYRRSNNSDRRLNLHRLEVGLIYRFR